MGPPKGSYSQAKEPDRDHTLESICTEEAIGLARRESFRLQDRVPDYGDSVLFSLCESFNEAARFRWSLPFKPLPWRVTNYIEIREENTMLAWIEKVNNAVNGFVWGVPAMICIMGSTMDLGLMWSVADTFNGLMAIPNLIALFLLSDTVVRLLKERNL